MLLAAGAACGDRTGLDVVGGLFETSQTDASKGTRDGAVDGAPTVDATDTPDTPDAPDASGADGSGPCSVGSLLPGSTIPTWSIPVQPDGASILEDVYSVMVAADGAIFALGCGDLGNVVQAEFSNGGGPCFLAKLDSNGRAIFIDRFVNDVNDPLSAGMVDDHEGGVVVGLRYDEQTDLGGVWEPPGCGVERLNSCGDAVWAHAFPGLDCVTSFAFAGDQNARSTLAASCGSYCTGSAIVVRLDEQGQDISKFVVTGATFVTAAVQSDDTLLLGGFGHGNIDFGAGSQALGNASIFLATYDGNLALEHFLSAATGGEQMQSVATADGSGFVIAGVLNSAGVDLGGGPLPYSGPGPTGGENLDIFLVRLTTQLGYVFGDAYGDTTDQETISLCLDSDGTVSWVGLAGTETMFGGLVISGDATVGADGFLARFAPDGTPQSVVETPDGVRQLACLPGAYALAGYTGYPADLGAGTVPAGGYVVKRNRP